MTNHVVEDCRKPTLAHVRRNDDGSFAFMILKAICARQGE